MTEKEWLVGANPHQMMDFMNRKEHSRKSRLVGCALCRSIWEDLGPADQHAVELAERYADGLVSKPELTAGSKKVARMSPAWGVSRPTHRGSQTAGAMQSVVEAVYWIKIAQAEKNPALSFDEVRQLIQKQEIELICCIFGNPFRPTTILPEWRTSTVLALATGIYEEKAFDRMPILADALQDSGCSNEDILNHCRGPGPHVRGCFLIDLILGKQ